MDGAKAANAPTSTAAAPVVALACREFSLVDNAVAIGRTLCSIKSEFDLSKSTKVLTKAGLFWVLKNSPC